MSDLIVDGVIPGLLDDDFAATDLTQANAPVNAPGILTPVVESAEIVNQPHPPISVAAVVLPPDSSGEEPLPAAFASGGRRPRFDDLLKTIPWLTTGGSLMGWSKLKEAKRCLRSFYWSQVIGLELQDSGPRLDEDGKPRISPLHLGALVHASIEGFYRAGLAGAWQPLEAVKAYYPEVALEARRLVSFYFQQYNAQEISGWDVRAVERESRYFYPARKCAGKRRSLCVSSRADGVYRPIQPGQARLQPGAKATSVRLHELKTTGSLFWSRLRGFYQDAQVMLQLLSWNHGRATRDGAVLPYSNAELIGPSNTVTVTHIGKAKRQDPNKDIDRSNYVVPDERVWDFAADLEDWYYEEVAERLFSPHFMKPDTWRKDWNCKDIFYQGWICPFVSVCEAGTVDTSGLYTVQSDRALKRELLELPKTSKSKAKRGKAAATVEGK